MPNKDYVLSMAQYNSWQNDSLVQAASCLNEEERQKDREAFFGSIQRTFSHILWADHIWLSRFTNIQAPSCGISESTQFFDNWKSFCEERARFDGVILNWAHKVEPSWFSGNLSWFSGAIGRDVTKPKAILALQLFNHQTHHRGQIHAMLTATGAKLGDTDIPFMPEHYGQS